MFNLLAQLQRAQPNGPPPTETPRPTVGGLERAPELFNNFNTDHYMRSPVLLGGITMLLGLLLILVTLRAWKQRDQKAHPMATFNRVANALGLSVVDKWLLVRIARFSQLPTPLTLLLSPATLRHHAKHFAAEQTVNGRMRVMKRVAFIRQLMASP